MFVALHVIVEMLGRFVGPHIEVVLHDLSLSQPSVIAIANGYISNRSIGSSFLSGSKQDGGYLAVIEGMNTRVDTACTVVSDYSSVAFGGRQLKSGTIIFRDTNGDPFAALSLNADMSNFEALRCWLRQILESTTWQQIRESEHPQMDDLMLEIINDAVLRLGKSTASMNKEEKISAVQIMLQRGLFVVRGSVERAAESLGVSRFTIYNYLDILRKRQNGSKRKSG